MQVKRAKFSHAALFYKSSSNADLLLPEIVPGPIIDHTELRQPLAWPLSVSHQFHKTIGTTPHNRNIYSQPFTPLGVHHNIQGPFGDVSLVALLVQSISDFLVRFKRTIVSFEGFIRRKGDRTTAATNKRA